MDGTIGISDDSPMRKDFVQPCETREGAWELVKDFAADLRRRGLAGPMRVGVEHVRTGPRTTTYYVVLYTDDDKEETA